MERQQHYRGLEQTLVLKIEDGKERELTLRVRPELDEDVWLDFVIAADHPRRDEYLAMNRPTDLSVDQVALCAELRLPILWWVIAFDAHSARCAERGPCTDESAATSALGSWVADPRLQSRDLADGGLE